MRRQDQVVVPWLDHHVAHGDGRKIARLERRPARSRVDGDPQAELRPEEQQVRAHGIFADDVGVTADARRLR